MTKRYYIATIMLLLVTLVIQSSVMMSDVNVVKEDGKIIIESVKTERAFIQGQISGLEIARSISYGFGEDIMRMLEDDINLNIEMIEKQLK